MWKLAAELPASLGKIVGIINHRENVIVASERQVFILIGANLYPLKFAEEVPEGVPMHE